MRPSSIALLTLRFRPEARVGPKPPSALVAANDRRQPYAVVWAKCGGPHEDGQHGALPRRRHRGCVIPVGGDRPVTAPPTGGPCAGRPKGDLRAEDGRCSAASPEQPFVVSAALQDSVGRQCGTKQSTHVVTFKMAFSKGLCATLVHLKIIYNSWSFLKLIPA